MNQDQPATPPLRAAFAATLGERAHVSADLTVTTGGLLAIGALVSSILVSSAVIVLAARSGTRRRNPDQLPAD